MGALLLLAKMKPPSVRNTLTGVSYVVPLLRPWWITMPKPGNHPAKHLVTLFVTLRLK